VTATTNHDIELGDIEIPIGDKYRSNLTEILGHSN